MNEGNRRTSDARLAAEALLSNSATLSGSLTAINYGLVACIFLYRAPFTLEIYFTILF